MFSLVFFTHDSELKKSLFLFVCPRTRSRGKKFQKLEKKEEKNNCLSSFHTEDCCATDYHDHVSLPPRDRERDGETERFCCCCREEEEEDDNRI